MATAWLECPEFIHHPLLREVKSDSKSWVLLPHWSREAWWCVPRFERAQVYTSRRRVRVLHDSRKLRHPLLHLHSLIRHQPRHIDRPLFSARSQRSEMTSLAFESGIFHPRAEKTTARAKRTEMRRNIIPVRKEEKEAKKGGSVRGQGP